MEEQTKSCANCGHIDCIDYGCQCAPCEAYEDTE